MERDSAHGLQVLFIITVRLNQRKGRPIDRYLCVGIRTDSHGIARQAVAGVTWATIVFCASYGPLPFLTGPPLRMRIYLHIAVSQPKTRSDEHHGLQRHGAYVQGAPNGQEAESQGLSQKQCTKHDSIQA